ncbi:MAG TPA: lysophospholipid acyltransferase family protein, partial [Flavisolibacter sp.]|nr:lysophospholipid acyltransferase family protein [Flavisolibacter sp.]
IRKRTGAKLLPATEMRNSMVPYRNKVYMLALVADQNPSNPKRAHWFNFFGRPTPFLIGPEKGAKGVNAAVVFIYFTKKKRGFYEAHFKLVTEDPANVPETQLTKEYVAFLEETIRQNPDMWLWSHRRWKWDWKPEYGPVIS